MPNQPVGVSAQLCPTKPPVRRYSERNLLNSVATHLAAALLCENYLIFWHQRGVLQTPAGWYLDFEANREAYLADPAFAAYWNGAAGVLSIVTGTPAVPRVVQRLIDDASVGPADVAAVPVLSLELVGVLPTTNYELGSKRKERARHLVVDSYVRSEYEKAVMTDLLAEVLEDETLITVYDHDAGDATEVGPAIIKDSIVVSHTDVQGAEATTYEVLLNARLVYIA